MKKILCLNCGIGQAQRIEPFGMLPCKQCILNQRQYSVKEAIEITTSEIKESRKEYSKDILQRMRGDTPSKEYIKAYGTKGFSREELKRAKNVWTENKFYKDD